MKRLMLPALLTLAAVAGSGTMGSAAADTTLVIGIAADPTGFDPEAVLEQHLRLRHGDDVRQPRQVQAGHGRGRAGPRRELGRLAGRPAPTPSICARASSSTTARRSMRRTTSRRSSASSTSRSPIRSTTPARWRATSTTPTARSPPTRAPDDNTVVFKMKEPSAPFLNSLAMVWNGVVSPAAVHEVRQGLPQPPGRHRAVHLQGMALARPDRARRQPGLLARQAEGRPHRLQGAARRRRPRCSRSGGATCTSWPTSARRTIPAAQERRQPRRRDAARPGRGRGLAAVRRQAVRRRAGAAGAELGGRQGGDQQVAVPGPGGDADRADAAGAMGARSVAEGVSGSIPSRRRSCSPRPASATASKVRAADLQLARAATTRRAPTSRSRSRAISPGRHRGRRAAGGYGRVPRRGALRQVRGACAWAAGAATTATRTISAGALFASQEHPDQQLRALQERRGRQAAGRGRAGGRPRQAGRSSTRQPEAHPRRRAVDFRQLGAAGPGHAQGGQGLPAQPDADVLRHGEGVAGEIAGLPRHGAPGHPRLCRSAAARVTDGPSVPRARPLAGRTALVTGAGTIGIGRCDRARPRRSGRRCLLPLFRRRAPWPRRRCTRPAAAPSRSAPISATPRRHAVWCATRSPRSAGSTCSSTVPARCGARRSSRSTTPSGTICTPSICAAPSPTAQEAARHMVERGGGGRIVIVSSVNQETVNRGLVHYAATKGGLMQLAKGLALELAEHRITVNLIAPGTIETDLNRAVLADPEIRRRRLPTIPAGRFGQPEDVVAAALFLRRRRRRLRHRVDDHRRWRAHDRVGVGRHRGWCPASSTSSFRRKPESIFPRTELSARWIPAFAGMTTMIVDAARRNALRFSALRRPKKNYRISSLMQALTWPGATSRGSGTRAAHSAMA